jgi:NAD(P)H-dependent FMN reductase
MRVLLIAGSVSPGSCTRAAVSAAATLLEDKGVETVVWDLGERPLPFADPAYHHDPEDNPHPAVRELVEEATEATSFVLASPVYHNSYSGVLKNCLDHLAIPQFLYKPVGLISHGAGLSAVQVCDHLRIVVRGLYGVALPRQLVTVKDDYDFDGEAAYLVGEAALERLEALVNEMLMFGKVTEVGLNGYRRLVRA